MIRDRNNFKHNINFILYHSIIQDHSLVIEGKNHVFEILLSSEYYIYIYIK